MIDAAEEFEDIVVTLQLRVSVLQLNAKPVDIFDWAAGNVHQVLMQRISHP